MRADDLLRRYLEQRRELGERELVLDGMSVEEVMRLIGAARSANAPAGAEPVSGEAAALDWRDSLRAAGAIDPVPSADRGPAPVSPVPEAPPDVPAGLVVGTDSRELFGGELGQ